MKVAIFYEKPGCSGNAKQKKMLLEAGFTLDVRNILEHGLSVDELSTFFEHRPMQEWVNPNAPSDKAEAICLDEMDEAQLLLHFIKEPIMIRRPLVQIGEHKFCGFEDKDVDRYGLVSYNKIEACNSSTACKEGE